jgi:Domain of unknown function (DUF4178)
MTVANCPSCGAQVEFAIGTSSVVVCNTCRSVVARTDRGVEDHGKVAALIETGSPLQLGATGNYRGRAFRIMGRTQLRHQAGGMWDEWYAAFDDESWGWIAEAQGRFYITFRTADDDAPPYESLTLGARVLDDFTVAEIGTAAIIAAQGELPYKPTPGAEYPYADLTGPERRFATIDYSETPPLVFKGAEATLSQLGITEGARASARARLTTLNCTQCGGALDLKAPDQAERIWCPYCGSGHDVTQGKLQFFRKLEKSQVEPIIPLGTTGTIDGAAYVVAGFMERAVRLDRDYFWTEYLLYNPEQGYRWLVQSDGHWSFVTPLRPGEVTDAEPEGTAMNVHHAGRSYRLFQHATARVTHVLGEFYWRVNVGEQVDTVDYVSPPFGISKELTREGAREINYSHARYAEPKEIATAFNVEGLERPSGVGPMQPFPGSTLGGLWMLMLALLIGVAFYLGTTLPNRVVHEQTYDLATAVVPQNAPENARVLFSYPFELSGENNVEVKAEAASPINNSWLWLGVDLVDETTGTMQSVELPLEHYSGVDQGERWSEGNLRRNRFLSRPGKGRHVLRVEAQWGTGFSAPPSVKLRVREGVFRISYLLLALVAISILPFFAMIRKISWESRRWQDSSYSPFGQLTDTGEDDDEEE